MATSDPILPQPINPTVLDFNSIPLKSSFSHFLLIVEKCANGIFLASEKIKLIACSAVVLEVLWGEFITIIPLDVALLTSTLSTPTPARAITFKRFDFSIIFFVIFVEDLTITPS